MDESNTADNVLHVEFDVEISGKFAEYYRNHPEEVREGLTELLSDRSDPDIQTTNLRITERPAADAATGLYGVAYIAESLETK